MLDIRLVLLDRDGVVNFDSPDYILNAAQWVPIPGSLAAIQRLNQAGIQVALCSNQSALGRGMMTEGDFTGIQEEMMTALEHAGAQLDYVAYCIHHPDDGCACRKPLAGLLRQAMQAIHASSKQTIMIGDSLRDIQAAQAAGVQSMLVSSGYGDAKLIHRQAQDVDASIVLYDDLAACVDVILGDY